MYDDIRVTYNRTRAINRQIEIFSRCPRTRKLLCPANKNFDIVECICFLSFDGVIQKDIFSPQFCVTDFTSLPRRQLQALRRRCEQPRKFTKYLPAFVGTVCEICAVLEDKNCCSAIPPLPPLPTRPPSHTPSLVTF